MYLVCGSDASVSQITKLLDEAHILNKALSLIDIQTNQGQLAWLEQHIHQYPLIIFNSPAAIQLSVTAIKTVKHATFFTVGRATALQLKQFTALEVMYPEKNSGGLALFDEKLQALEFSNAKVLIIKGEEGSLKLEEHFTTLGVSFKVAAIYRRVKRNLAGGYLKKLLILTRAQGIIITSSLLVDWLIDCAREDDCLDLLLNLRFITIHPNIAQRLANFGLNKVYLTAETSKQSIIKLIRDLDE